MQNETQKVALDGWQGQDNTGSSQRSCLCPLCVSPRALAVPACPSRWSYMLHWVTPKDKSLKCPNSSVHLLPYTLGLDVPPPPYPENDTEPRWIMTKNGRITLRSMCSRRRLPERSAWQSSIHSRWTGETLDLTLPSLLS